MDTGKLSKKLEGNGSKVPIVGEETNTKSRWESLE
jgi:hypothetical protein